MTRAELSDDGATWTIPSERTKNHRTHVVPLPPLARDILAAVPRIESAAGYLFTLSGARPVTSFSGAKAQLDAAMLTVAREDDPASAVVPRWTLHDLRRTAATGMAELGIAPHIVEACLNHVSGAQGRRGRHLQSRHVWTGEDGGAGALGRARRRASSAGQVGQGRATCESVRDMSEDDRRSPDQLRLQLRSSAEHDNEERAAAYAEYDGRPRQCLEGGPGVRQCASLGCHARRHKTAQAIPLLRQAALAEEQARARRLH